MKPIKKISARTKQVIILFIISVVWSMAGIIHGVFFDLDFNEIRRLSFLGIIFSTIILFPSILLFEYIFDWNNKADINKINDRIDTLEQKINDLKCIKSPKK